MKFFTEKVILPIFIFGLKTKRFAKSAINGKINYEVKKTIPYAVGALVIGWSLFIFVI